MNILRVRFQLLCSSLAQKPFSVIFNESPIESLAGTDSIIIAPYAREVEEKFGLDFEKQIFNCQLLSFAVAQWIVLRMKLDHLELISGHIPNKIDFIDLCHASMDTYASQINAIIEQDMKATILDSKLMAVADSKTIVPPLAGAVPAPRRISDHMWSLTRRVYHQFDSKMKIEDLNTHDTVRTYMYITAAYPELGDQLEFMQTASNMYGPLNEVLYLAILWDGADEMQKDLTHPSIVSMIKYKMTRQKMFGADKLVARNVLRQHRLYESVHLLKLKRQLIKDF
jgi:hypothetical protein